jgi:hypothetical protein
MCSMCLNQCLKIQREQKIRRQANPSHFTKFSEIREKSTEMYLMSEMNMNFLKTQKSAKFAELSAELAGNSAE